MKYAVSATATRNNLARQVVSSVTSLYLFNASSVDEAVGIGYRAVEKTFPARKGWNHYVACRSTDESCDDIANLPGWKDDQ